VGAGHPERLPALARELVALKVDVIVTAGTVPIRAAKDATETIPIVFVVLVDPVATGLVTSFARPGGNATGWASQFEELATKQPQLMKEALPGLSASYSSRVSRALPRSSAGRRPRRASSA